MTDNKITDKQLEQEILKGKSQKEIAHDYGFGYPSATLSRRIQSLGYQKLNKLSETGYGGATLSFKSSLVDQIKDENGFSEDQKIYYRKELLEDGSVRLEFNNEKWVEKQ